jgi:ribonuclease T1
MQKIGWVKLASVFAIIAIGATLYATQGIAREASAKAGTNSSIGQISTNDLPKQGRETLTLIRKGGPFPYSKDGTVFGNRERALPKQARGYYKEFTVKTPGSRDRGARRIVCGGEVTNPAKSECFYTDDHYASFKRIKE